MTDSYLKHWQIKSNVFASSDKVDAFFLSESIARVLKKVFVFCEQGGCNISLSAPDGFGKSALAHYLYYKFPIMKYEVCLLSLLGKERTNGWLMPRLAEFFAVPIPKPPTKEYLSSLILRQIDDLTEENKKLIVIIDGAESIANEQALEEINTLNKLQVLTQTNISFIFLGSDVWQSFTETQTVRNQFKYIARLPALNFEEMQAYFRHILTINSLSANVFSNEAIETIFALTEGVLASINAIGENCLIEGFLQEKKRVDVELVLEAAKNTGQFFTDARVSSILEKIKQTDKGKQASNPFVENAPNKKPVSEPFTSEPTEILLANLFKKGEAG